MHGNRVQVEAREDAGERAEPRPQERPGDHGLVGGKAAGGKGRAGCEGQEDTASTRPPATRQAVATERASRGARERGRRS